MKYSIITLNRNGMAYLPVFFTSLRKTLAGRTDVEVIVVDNASTDGSQRYIKDVSESFFLTLIENTQNVSFAQGNNDAAHKARGDFLIFANNDIEFTAGWLENFQKCYDSNDKERPGSVGSVGAKLIFPRSNSQHKGTLQHCGIKFARDPWTHCCVPYHFLQYDSPEKCTSDMDFPALTAALLFVHAKKFLAVNGFDEIYYYTYEDVDLGLRLHKKGLRNILCSDVLAYHHESPTQNVYRKKNSLHEQKIQQSKEYFFTRWNNYLSDLMYAHIDEVNTFFAEQSLEQYIRDLEKNVTGPMELNHYGLKDRESLAYVRTSLSRVWLRRLNAVLFAVCAPQQFLHKIQKKRYKK